MSTEGKLPITYRVSQIKTKKISINEPDKISFENIEVFGEVTYKLNALNDKTSLLEFEIITEFVDTKAQENLINHVGLTRFEINNLPASIGDTQSDLRIQDNLMITLYGIAHSHSRALLACDLQNFIYKDKLFIPIVDPKRILDLIPATP